MAAEKMGMARIPTKPCFHCGKGGQILVQMNDYLEWQAGKLIQHAFPAMPAEQREQLITGTHPACWAEMFADEEED